MLCMLMNGCFDAPRLPPAPKGLFPSTNTGWADGLDSLFLYSYGFCIVIIAACIAVLIWAPLPSLKKWALMGLTFAGVVMGMGITFSIIKPFLPIIVLSGIAIGVGIGVWYIIANFDALRQFIHKDNKDDLTAGAQKLVTACQNLPLSK